MSDQIERIAFRPKKRQRKAQRTQQETRLAERSPARVARRLALAHRLAAELEAGHYSSYNAIARHHNLTRARLSQLMNLLLLAPDIQEEVLALEFTVGRDPVSERMLRSVVAKLSWEEQRMTWGEMRTSSD